MQISPDTRVFFVFLSPAGLRLSFLCYIPLKLLVLPQVAFESLFDMGIAILCRGCAFFVYSPMTRTRYVLNE